VTARTLRMDRLALDQTRWPAPRGVAIGLGTGNVLSNHSTCESPK
jgi:hypothetical protein